jgi:hypothetical protein
LIYLCGLPPFVGAVTYEKKLLCFNNVDLYMRIYFINFIYNNVLFLNLLFRYNTLFIYTRKNILLIVGIIFSVLLVPDKHLQVFECPVVVCLIQF